MDQTTTLFRVKATRAMPPGLAIEEDRRPTYDAALAQFDELIMSAQTASAATRPLPLFYALSQAGRAIAAARVPLESPWRLKLHGISAPDLDHPFLSIKVRRRPGHTAAKGPGDGPKKPTDVVDSFTGIATVLDGDVFTGGLSLGELWASLPEITHLLPDAKAGGAARPIVLVPEQADELSKMTRWSTVDAVVIGLGESDAEGLREQLRAYLPSRAPEPSLYRVQGLDRPVTVHTEFGLGVKVCFEADRPNPDGHLHTLWRIAPDGLGFEPRRLMPQIGGVAMGRVTRWWTFLFGLSMLARYEPGRWLSTLDLASSDLAAPIQEALHIALEAVPALVLDSLRDPEKPPYHGSTLGLPVTRRS